MKIFARIFLPFLALSFFSNCFAEDTARIITISEGLRLATDNNRIIKIASLNKDIASADTLVAKSKLLPSLNASFSQTYLSHQIGALFDSRSAFLSQKDYLSYGINVYQTIYDFGANISLYEASKTFLDVTKLDLVRIRNLVALDFINTYFDLLETEKMILVSQKEVERFEAHLRVAQSLYTEGVITKNDLLQAEVMLSDAKQRLLTMKNRRSTNASKMNNILARPINAEVQVIDVPMNASEALELEKTWKTDETERSEIKIIDHELQILNLQETVTKSEYYPKLFAQGGYNFTENRYQFPEGNWSLVLGMNLNLFSGGSTKAEVSKVIYRREQLLEQKSKLMDDIRLEVEKSYLDLKNAVEKIQVTKDAASQAEENLRIHKIRYEEGIGTSTDVVDAITLLTTAETNHYRAVYELRRAQAELQYAMGWDLVSTYSH
ncbi:MAG: TolC family protein [Nitrospirota bacterium]